MNPNIQPGYPGGQPPPMPPPSYPQQPPQGRQTNYPPSHSTRAGAQAIPPSVVPADSGGEITGIPAFGTEIQVLSSASPEEYTTIEGVGDITGPNASVAETETTSHSTGKPHRTFIPTLIDDGDLSFPCFFNPSDPTHSLYSGYGLENLFQNRAVTKFRLINTDASHRTREFRGFVRNLGETYPVQGVCTRNTTIRITSVPLDVAIPVTFTPTSAAPLAAGGAATLGVALGGDTTPWTATKDVAWITIDSPTTPTTGDATVNYTVAVNGAGQPARTGHITVLGNIFTVTQGAG